MNTVINKIVEAMYNENIVIDIDEATYAITLCSLLLLLAKNIKQEAV